VYYSWEKNHDPELEILERRSVAGDDDDDRDTLLLASRL
jgi:hypothetical protein